MPVSRPNSFKMLISNLVVTVCWMVISAQAFVDQSERFSSYNEISDIIKDKPTYIVIASKIVRPGQVYKIMATILEAAIEVNVKASIQRDGVEVVSASQDCKANIPETLLLKIPASSVYGAYKLRIEGKVTGVLNGAGFFNESSLQFNQQSMTIFIQTDRPIYMQGQTVRFRAVPITTDLKAFPDTVDVFMLNPNRSIVRRWLSRQTNFGAVTLDYSLSEQPVYGNWTIQVVAQGQVEENSFQVEEYYQTQYEINVTVPAFMVDTDDYILGSVMANYTSGVPVPGNLSIVASIEPIEPHYRVPSSSSSIRQYFEIFEGYMDFKISLRELETIAPQLDKSKVRITAYVGERYLDMIESGFAETLIFSSYIKLKFLGSSPQIFKPVMPFTAYLAVSNHDGTSLSERRLQSHKLLITPTLHMRDGKILRLNTRQEMPSKTFDGVWEIPIELDTEIRNEKDLYAIEYMTLNAHYTDETFDEAKAQLKVYSSYSRSNIQLQITTSTKDAKVGEYIIFHVRSNYFVEGFSYVILSKGIILLTGQEKMAAKIKTFAVALSPEMAPTSTIVVYNIGRSGEVIADSLTFPVDGISRNNFEVELNNRKDKTGDTIEVVIRGRPGSYVGLASVDKILYDMQSGGELSYASVLEKMNSFDVGVNGTLSYTWYSKEGKPIRVVNYPSTTYGIDTNRTFEFAQLLVFTDANVTKVFDNCNITAGYAACLDRSCYSVYKRCDKQQDCLDGSDESGCTSETDIHYSYFRMYRLNRIQRLYDNAWLWHNINIGPLGHYIFNVPVPELPVRWIITAFGVNTNEGFGLLKYPLEFSSLKPFYMNVEMPSKCMQGEQIGIRISIFNYLVVEIEVLVILENSLDFKFVHVGPFGRVQSYNPKTSFGEHQHLVFIKPGQTTVVYMPIVPTRLGDINVTITAKTQVAKHAVTKMLHVKADGITQYKHSSLLLDLSEGAYLIKYLDTNITEVPTIPFQYDRLYVFGSNQAAVSVVGDIVGPAFPTMPVNASVLLHKPSWCGEQNMFNFAANMYMLLYLRKTGQRQIDIEKQAFYHLNKGYQQQLSYQADDGSFFPFRWFKEPSVWLTAFCIKTLHKATFQEWENFLYIDPTVLSRAVNWILNYQASDGSFYETSLHPLDRKMNQSSEYQHFGVKLRNISLTAHVLIALEEVKHIQEEARMKIAEARQKAVKYLENNLHTIKDLKDPYQLAITTYALTVANSGEGSVAFNALDKRRKDSAGMTYWGKVDIPPIAVVQENNRPYIKPRLPNMYDASNVETTAYALLSYVARQGMLADTIVEWLNCQRLTDGGWASTQDTILALEALIAYAETSFIREVTNLNVVVEVPSTLGFSKEIKFNKENLFKMQRFEIPNAWGPAIVKARGSGIGIVQMSTQYNIDWSQHQIPPPIDSFSLDIRTYLFGRNSSHIKFHSCQRWTFLEESYSSGMAVLEVDIPTGYIIQQQALDRLINSHKIRNLREARFSERKVSIYFTYLDSRPTCLSFTVQRWYPVANMTRYIAARVYDYYAPERFNETMIDMYSLYVIHICQVCGSYQCPYCPIFSWSPLFTYSPFLTTVCVLLALSVFLQKH